ncbi:collagen-like repeat preface domain-containing protein [Paenibacillus glacialis]|uniref:collagen-like repeat preface domain-containing protein n=1 Tax=Paenibacillus glacialis TaxID=494026 RepID=UPI003CCC44F7
MQSILELTIVSTEITPFSVIGVGTNLQQLLAELLVFVLVNIEPCCKDKLVIQIRSIQVSITIALGLYTNGAKGPVW